MNSWYFVYGTILILMTQGNLTTYRPHSWTFPGHARLAAHPYLLTYVSVLHTTFLLWHNTDKMWIRNTPKLCILVLVGQQLMLMLWVCESVYPRNRILNWNWNISSTSKSSLECGKHSTDCKEERKSTSLRVHIANALPAIYPPTHPLTHS